MQQALGELLAELGDEVLEPAAVLRRAQSRGLVLSRDDLQALYAVAGAPGGFAMPGVVTDFLCAYLRGRSIRPRVLLDLWAAAGWMLPPLVAALSPAHAIGVVPDEGSAALAALLAGPDQIDWRTDDVRTVVATLDPGIDVVLGCPPWRWQPRRIRVETPDGPVELTEDPANVAVLTASSLLGPDGIGLFVVGPGFVMRPGRATAFPNLGRFGLSLHLLLELPRGIVSPDSGSGRLLIGIGPAACSVPLVGTLPSGPYGPFSAGRRAPTALTDTPARSRMKGPKSRP